MDLDRQMGLRPTEGTIVAGRHLLPMRVYYEDTDWSGVVYHASYLRFLERGRTEFLRAAGVDQSILHAEGEGLTFAVRRMTIDYLRAARMDDVLLVETHTGEVRGASLVVAVGFVGDRRSRGDADSAARARLADLVVRSGPRRWSTGPHVASRELPADPRIRVA